jgi:hypothetical protein
MNLPRIVKPFPDETIRGVLTRLAEKNGFPTPSMAADALGITFHQMGTAIDVVAKACEAPPASLAWSTPVLQGRAAVHLAGQTLRATHVSTQLRRWCLACLAERPSHRFCWDVSAVSTCPTHRIRLLDRCPNCLNHLRWRNPSMTVCETCSLDLTKVDAEPAPETELSADSYTLGRLGVLPVKALRFADDVDLGDALTYLDRLGRISMGGYHASAPSADELGVSTSGLIARGIDIVSHWPNALHASLDRLVEQSRPKIHADNYGCNWSYGWAYNWAVKLPDNRFARAIRAEITKHAATSFSIKRGPSLLDFETHQPRLQTVRDAALEVGMFHITMRRLCVALGFIPKRGRSGVQFALTPEQVAEMKAAIAGSMNMCEVADRLGFSVTTAVNLIKAKVLKPWVLAGRGGLNAHIFRMEDVEGFYSALRGAAPTELTARPGTKPFAAACQAAGIDAQEACKLVFAGKFAPVSVLAGKKGLEGLLFDVKEMVALEHSLRPWLTVDDVADKLDILQNTARELVRLKLLVSERTEVDGKAFWRVEPSSVDQFARDYVKGSDYADVFQTNGRHASNRLKALGLKPVIDMSGGFQTAIFNRSQAELAIQGLSTCRTWTKETRALFWGELGRALEFKGSPYSLDRDYGQAAVLSVGRTGVSLVVRYQPKHNSIDVGIHIGSNMDREAFDILLAQKDEIEKELGFALTWLRHEAKTTMYAVVENTEFSLSNRAHWSSLHAWIAEVLPKFRDVFRPRVKTLPGRYRPKMKGVPLRKPVNEMASAAA